ncbi:glycosyltransferase [Pseudanabaena sp. FACHB-1998]|uniref:glycosyltransferase family 2 protein n=1 Tax=Pseudanabaena sp. FACHB-1998 TaxID=2692858 RepID=UPI001680E473|nr:glycosyltransferase [Pseudanabaena sp. FACHB-1998]MBD2178840.1 glycosyltransferase [Pseudanabaena sp. FACHB-1998]
MTNKPFFSILIPTYNQAQYLGAALDSAIAQTHTNWEAIIINDGSTDTTAEIIEIYCNKDSRFKAIHKENGGVSSALNKGLENARGEWICWLSSDDLFEPNKLEIHQKWINDFPDYKFFYSNYYQLFETTNGFTKVKINLSKEIPPIELQVVQLLKNNYIAGINICISKSAWLNVGLFNEKLRYAQDHDMWFRLMMRYPALFISEYTCLRRVHQEQGTNKFRSFCIFDSAKLTIQILNKYEIEDLLPLINLQDCKQIECTLKYILNIALDSNSFVYKFGFHPLLIFKIQKFIAKYIDMSNSINKVLIEKIRFYSNVFGDTPQGFWCKMTKTINSEFSFIVDDSFFLCFEKLGENYYWWLNYTNSDLQDDVLYYLHSFCGYEISFKKDCSSKFQNGVNEIIKFNNSESQEIYTKLLERNQVDFSKYTFTDQIITFEKFNVSLKLISKLVFEKYGKIIGYLIVFKIYTLRIFRLCKQGIVWVRFKNYLLSLIC